MSLKKIGIAASTTAAAGALVLGGSALADAAAKTPSPSASNAPGGHGRDASADTPVTGDELAKVTAAIKAKDPAVTVNTVRKDPDGSYDVFATKAGTPTMFDVSADLKTITQNTFGRR
jgi:hypothetical protein